MKGLCLLLQHLSGVLGKLQPGPRQETLPSAECKHALFNGDPAFAELFAQLCNSAMQMVASSKRSDCAWAVIVICHLGKRMEKDCSGVEFNRYFPSYDSVRTVKVSYDSVMRVKV